MTKHFEKDGINYTAELCPKQKLVKIFLKKDRKKSKNVHAIKMFRFQQDIPKHMKTVEKTGYDYSAWSVSERDFKYDIEVCEWDNKVVNSILDKTINYFLELEKTEQ